MGEHARKELEEHARKEWDDHVGKFSVYDYIEKGPNILLSQWLQCGSFEGLFIRLLFYSDNVP